MYEISSATSCVRKSKESVQPTVGRSSFENTDVKVDPVRRDVPFHQIQLLDSVVQILDDNVYPIVRLDERVNVRL
jgi:hypothetical protein